MIEFRTFEGDAQELAEFSQRVWIKAYGGKLPIPLWGPEFFEWQLFDQSLHARDYMVAAYDGAKLVGMLPCQPVDWDYHGTPYSGTICSWQSVDPDYRRQGISRGTLTEQYRRQMERNLDFSIGYPLSGSIGSSFWANGSGAGTIRKLGYWFRLLDHRSAAEWEPAWWAALGARALGLLQRSNPEPSDCSGIRPYESRDLPACLDLLRALQRESDLSMNWSKERLQHQLAYKGLPRTLVFEKNGTASGFVNYHLTPLLGKKEILNATVDLIVIGSLSSADRQNLLRFAFRQMREDGATLATAPCMSVYPSIDMIRAGCLPFPAVVRIDYFIAHTTVPLETVRRVFLICR